MTPNFRRCEIPHWEVFPRMINLYASENKVDSFSVIFRGRWMLYDSGPVRNINVNLFPNSFI